MARAIALNPWMTVQEVADLMGVHVNTVWKWRSAGTGPRYFQNGTNGLIRYRASDVEKFLDAHSSRPKRTRP